MRFIYSESLKLQPEANVESNYKVQECKRVVITKTSKRVCDTHISTINQSSSEKVFNKMKKRDLKLEQKVNQNQLTMPLVSQIHYTEYEGNVSEKPKSAKKVLKRLQIEKKPSAKKS